MDSSSTPQIIINCWDKDKFKEDDYLGTVTIPFTEWHTLNHSKKQWYKLNGPKHERISGDLQLGYDVKEITIQQALEWIKVPRSSILITI